MIRVEFFCTRCNQSAVKRDPGDEVNTGYFTAVAANPDRMAQGDIPRLPPGWEVVSGGLVCGACLDELDDHRPAPPREDVPDVAEVEREANAPSPGYRPPPDGWPSRQSPFSVPMHD